MFFGCHSQNFGVVIIFEIRKQKDKRFLFKYIHHILQSLTMLGNQRTHIFQQIQTVKSYMERYKDLPLSRTLQLWQTALQHNFYAEYRLLYASEIAYTLQQAEISVPAKTAAHLDATIEVQIPNILKFVNEMVTQAEEAYAPTAPKASGGTTTR